MARMRQLLPNGQVVDGEGRPLECLNCQQTRVWCGPGCKVTMTKKKKKSSKWLHTLARNGHHSVVWNNILEYLAVVDVVKVLTLLRKYKPTFMASPKLLTEVIHLAMPEVFEELEELGTVQVSFNTISDTTVVMDTKLSKDGLKRLYNFAKLGIKSECKPSKTIEVDDHLGLCTFSRRIKKDINRERWLKIELPVNQCSEYGCNRIVLWTCSTCLSLSSECRKHIHICDWCDRNICDGCSINECLCTECGFCCVHCDRHCVLENDPPFTCQGPRGGISWCPYDAGPMCGDCANDDDTNNINECVDCGRQACVLCETMFYCDGCQSMSCTECGPHDDDDDDEEEEEDKEDHDYYCDDCDNISPFVWYCNQCNETCCTYCKEASVDSTNVLCDHCNMILTCEHAKIATWLTTSTKVLK